MASVLLACGGGNGNEPSADAGTPSMILGTPVSADEAQPWNGMAPIEVISQNGDLTIIGDSSDGKIHITGTPFVVAVAGDPNIAPALADVASGIAVDGTNQIGASCSYASRTYGDIARTSTGCMNVVVHLPPGTAMQPLRLTAHAYNGPLTVENVNLFDVACSGGCPPNIQSNVLADNGALVATGLVGSVYALAKAGDLTVSATPNAPQQIPNPMQQGTFITESSTITIESVKGNVALSLPSDFATNSLTLDATSGTCTVSGFPDTGWSNPGSISAIADDGNLTLTSM